MDSQNKKGISDINKRAIMILVVLAIETVLVLGIYASSNPSVEIAWGHLFREKPSSEQEIVSKCQNLEFVDKVACVRSEILLIYNYKVSPDSERSFEDIVTNGGDCHDYSLIYQRIFNSLNLGNKIISYDMNDINSHVFNLVYNGGEYCTVDQTSPMACRG